jgi:hypothetical protein
MDWRFHCREFLMPNDDIVDSQKKAAHLSGNGPDALPQEGPKCMVIPARKTNRRSALASALVLENFLACSKPRRSR